MKFFSIHATASPRIGGEKSPTLPAGPPDHPTEDVTKNLAYREFTTSKEQGQKPSSEHLFDTTSKGEGEDEHDTEFERD